jgi:4-amino-4-deoxy-L-arabinose transferase-like glycosyltransferase
MTVVDDSTVDAPKERTVSVTLANAALLLTLAFAAAIRLWDISAVPPELHPDEYAGWIGIADMLNGRNPPSIFLDYGVVYLPLYGLFETVSAWIFSPTIAAFRAPAALLGAVTALGTGLLGYQLCGRRVVLLLACVVMALLPWDISASRIGWEPAAMLPFLLLGLYFVRRGLYANSERDATIGLVLLAVGAYSYRAESFYAATLVTALLAIEYERTRALARGLWIGCAAAVLVLIPLIYSVAAHPHMLTSGPAQGTFDSGVNRYSLIEFRNLYVSHFSPAALFLTGDGTLQHGPPVGVLYPWMAPFILLGLIASRRLFPLRARLFALVWLVLYPLGGSVTDENGGQHFIRTIAGAPLFCILTAIGLLAAWQWLQGFRALRRWPAAFSSAVATLFVAIVIVEFSQFCNAYFVRYPAQAAEIFHYGDRDVFAFVNANDAGYDRVCFTALDAWNYTAQVRYYMPDTRLTLFGSMDPSCSTPKSFLALKSQSEAPRFAQFLGTVQRRDGTIRAYFYGFR